MTKNRDSICVALVAGPGPVQANIGAPMSFTIPPDWICFKHLSDLKLYLRYSIFPDLILLAHHPEVDEAFVEWIVNMDIKKHGQYIPKQTAFSVSKGKARDLLISYNKEKYATKDS